MTTNPKRVAVAIIQARMGSTRLPGKVLMKVGDRSLLAYLVERLRAATSLAAVVLATTESSQDDVLAQAGAALGVPVYRGSEEDVLGRYLAAATACNADIVVRVTADNPLTDPQSIDRVVARIREGCDFAIEEGLPVGTTGEAVSLEALKTLDRMAKEPRWREHVTLYAKENPQLFRTSRERAPGECVRPDLSFTVDTRADYEGVRDLCSRLPDPQLPLMNVIRFADEAIVVV